MCVCFVCSPQTHDLSFCRNSTIILPLLRAGIRIPHQSSVRAGIRATNAINGGSACHLCHGSDDTIGGIIAIRDLSILVFGSSPIFILSCFSLFAHTLSNFPEEWLENHRRKDAVRASELQQHAILMLVM